MRPLLLFIGGRRMDALWRVFAFLYSMFVASLIAGVVALVGIVWGVIDVLWQFLLNSEGLSEDSRPAKIVVDTLDWKVDLYTYSLTGKGDFMWLPDL